MRRDDYNKILDDTVESIKRLSTLKGGEYAGDDDVFASLRRNAANLGLSMEQVWAVYAAKHWDAINQYIKDLGKGTVRQRLEPITGRADDLIVYMVLLKAITIEREERDRNTTVISSTQGVKY